jgi:hypothetical protein
MIQRQDTFQLVLISVGAVAYLVIADAEKQKRQTKPERWRRKKMICPENKTVTYMLFLQN